MLAAEVMNEALAENVFVGLLCIMNRIPLFIVGKPGLGFSIGMLWNLESSHQTPLVARHIQNTLHAGLVACLL